jgi:hypothetical protein
MTNGDNVGNPVIVVSLYDTSGRVLEYIYDELIIGTCTNDSFSSASLAGQEPLTFQGQPSASGGMLNWTWPAGSGSTFSTTCVNPLATAGINWAANGSMENWTNAGTPVGWSIVTGTVGGTIYQSTAAGTVYDGLSSLGIAGTGSENTEFQQQFTTALNRGNQTQVLYPYTQLAVNLFMLSATGLGYGVGPYGSGFYGGLVPYGSGAYGAGGYGGGGSPPTGVLQVAMINGSGAIINDANGNPNVFTVNLASFLPGWNSASGVFRTPATLPNPVYLDFKMITPLSAGSTLFIDRVGVARMQPMYVGGPALSVFSGNQNLARGDSFQINVINMYSGKLQSLLWRLFNMPGLQLILPSSSSPSISDILIPN